MKLPKKLKAYRNIFANCFLYSATDTKGRIIDLNEDFCESVGYTKEELLGKSHRILRHPKMPKEEYQNLWKTIKAKGTYKGLMKNKTKNGATVYHNTTIIPLLDKKENIEGYIALRYDTTNEMLATKDLEKMMLHLIQKEQMLINQAKLAQMGEMIGMIAHQWRQPLSAISATTSDLNIKLQLGAIDENYFLSKLKNIGEFTEHLSTTIDDFREFFKQDKELEDISFEQVIESALKIINISLENKLIQVIKEYDSKGYVHVLQSELQQVALNLISNAKDVLVSNKIQNPYIKIKSFSKQNYEYLQISDNGGGVPPHLLEKIFEPYFSTKEDKEGMGLGLHMSRSIIQDHCKGTLTVKNSKDGAVFTIKIPAKVSETKL